jgi:hypothetical protein
MYTYIINANKLSEEFLQASGIPEEVLSKSATNFTSNIFEFSYSYITEALKNQFKDVTYWMLTSNLFAFCQNLLLAAVVSSSIHYIP